MNDLSKLLFIVLGILAIPLIAMQFTEEVVWTIGDFIIAGLLLFSVGAIILFLRSLTLKRSQKNLLIIMVLIIFLLVWAELAVGLFS